MQTFIHYKKQNGEKFLSELGDLQNKYVERDFDFDQKLKQVFEQSEDFFQQLGESTEKAEISRLKSYFETALRGIDPRKMEKLRKGRRENIWISAFDCLSQLDELYTGYLFQQNQKLDEAAELLEQIILSILQNNGANGSLLLELDSIEKIEGFWKNMQGNEQIRLAHHKLKLTLHEQDIYLLFDQIISRMKE